MAVKKMLPNSKKSGTTLSAQPAPAPPDSVKVHPPQSLEEEHVQLQVENQQLREAQSLLEGSREQYATLFDHAPIAYVVLDQLGMIQESNVHAAELLGRSHDQLSFIPFRFFVAEHDHYKFLSHLEQCRCAQGKRIITPLQLKTTPPRSVELASNAIRSSATGALIYQTAVIDHTPLVATQKEFQESRERYRMLFNSMAEIFALGEALRDERGNIVDFRILEVNAAWEQYIGMSAAQVVGRNLRDVLPQISGQWHSAMVNVINTGVALKEQIRGIMQDRWLILSAFRVPGNCIGILLLDISERKQVEEVLKQSEREYRLLFEESPVPMWIFDVDTLEIVQANDAALAQYGYSRGEFISSRITDLVVPEMRQALREAVRTHDPLYLPGGIWKHMKKDGTVISVEIVTHDLPLDGRKARLVHARNVTARVQAEEALRQSEELNRRIIEGSADCIMLLDLDGKLLSMSRRGQQLLEIHDLSPYLNTNWDSFWCGSDKARIGAAIATARAGQTGKLNAYRPTATGTPKWWDVVITPITDERGEAERLLAVSHDITERKRAEETLRQRDEELRYHIETSPLAVIEWDAGYIVKRWSPAAERIFGWTAEECLGKEIMNLNLICPEDVPIVERTMKRLNGGDEKAMVSENRNVTKDGRVINCVWYNSVLTDTEGKMSSVLSLVEDVTATKKATATLQKALDSLSVLISSSADSMVLLGDEGTVLCASKRAATSLGYAPADLAGKHWTDFVAEEQRTPARFYYADLVRNSSEQATATLKLQTATGSLAWYALQASMVSLGNGDGYLVYIERVSPDEERKN